MLVGAVDNAIGAGLLEKQRPSEASSPVRVSREPHAMFIRKGINLMTRALPDVTVKVQIIKCRRSGGV